MDNENLFKRVVRRVSASELFDPLLSFVFMILVASAVLFVAYELAKLIQF